MVANHDFLAEEVATRRSADREQQDAMVESTIEAIQGLHRFVKVALVHEPTNQAVQDILEPAHRSITHLAQLMRSRVTLTFVGDTIFVCGEPLKAPRRIYETAMELRDALRRCGASEIAFAPEIELGDLVLLAAPLRKAVTSRGAAADLSNAQLRNVFVRQVDAILEARDDEWDLDTEERIVAFYASALVALRRYFDALAQGRVKPPSQLKRIAHRLVGFVDGSGGSVLALSTMANAHRDDAGRALQAAILTVVVARGLTKDHVTLSRLAMAAMLADSGRTLLAGEAGRDRLVPLAPDVDRLVPMASAAVIVAGGGVNRASVSRTVAAHEATWMERASSLGPLYGGKAAPLVQSRILQAVRALLDRLAPRDTSRAMQPVEALQEVIRLPYVDPVMRKLLVSAMGFLPAGTLVELSDGMYAVVVGPSQNPRAMSRPRVRTVSNADGSPVATPRVIDLGTSEAGPDKPHIQRVVESAAG